jgi:hypothetical protein
MQHIRIRLASRLGAVNGVPGKASTAIPKAALRAEFRLAGRVSRIAAVVVSLQKRD